MTVPQRAIPRIDSELPPGADPLSEVLRLLELNGVLYCNAELTDPWGIEIPALPGVMNVKAMSLMHRQPQRDWRVETLAREIGMSRSGVSARFTARVGESVLP